MTRRLGVLVALLALSTTAAADKPKHKAAPAAKKAPAAKPAATDDAPPADDGAAQDGSAQDGSAAEDDGMPPHITGPKLVDIGNNMEIDLPADMILLEHDEGVKFVEKGGGTGEGIAALVFSPDDSWWMRIDYTDAGYVSDSDAKDLDANDLLKSFQDGTVEQNQRRASLGLPELFLDGWTVMPSYDKGAHHLTWGLKGHSTRGVSVNEFTRILGRNGFISVDLISSADKIDASRVAAKPTMAAIRFKKGFTYEDHSSSDKSSGMGLKTLMLGGAGVVAYGAVKSGGLIALLLGLKKGLILLVAGVAAFFKKIFGRNKNVQLPPDGPPPTDSPPVG